MEFYMKLPRNKREFILFLAIISIISINTIAPLISGFEAGFSLEGWLHTFYLLPLLWLSIIFIVLITHKPAEKITTIILSKNDSFNAHIIINTLCSVFLISVCMTVVGAWIGMGKVSLAPFHSFFYKWPRNFTIAFFIELCIAQPIARAVLFRLHTAQDSN